jgi:hypothetical protein
MCVSAAAIGVVVIDLGAAGRPWAETTVGHVKSVIFLGDN